MPTEEDDDDHDAIVTTTIPPSTVTPPPGFPHPSPDPSVTDIPDRPINAKPTNTPTPKPDPVTGELESSPSITETPSSWLPGFLPTFGVSPRTQAWIYASLALILVFCAGLGVYLYTARRRRLRNSPRDTYEFELLDEEEAEGLTAGEKDVGGGDAAAGRKKRTRGGELYDAFAGGSEDEGDDGEFYRDHDEGAGSSSAGSGSEATRREKRALGEEEQHVLGSDSEEEGGGDEREALRAGRR